MASTGRPKLAELLFRSGNVGRMSFLCGVKISESASDAVLLNAGDEYLISPYVISPLQTRSIVTSDASVLAILRPLSDSQVRPPIVLSVPVSVIEVIWRFFAGHHFPDYAMHQSVLSRHPDAVISHAFSHDYLAGKSFVRSVLCVLAAEMAARTIPPSEGAAIRIIRKALQKIGLVW